MSISYGPFVSVPLKLKESFGGLPHLVWIMGAITLLNASGRMVATFLAIYLSAVLGLGEAQVGLIVGAYGGGVVTGSLIGGWFSSRAPATPLMAASLACLGVGLFILSGVDSALLFLVGIFVCANFEGVFRPLSTLLFMRPCLPIDRPRAHAVYYTANSLGFAVGAAVGGLLTRIDYLLLFWVNALMSIVAAGAVLLFVRERKARALPGKLVKEEPVGAQSNSMSNAWPFAALCVAALLHYCVSNQRLATYPLYMTDHYGLDPAEIGAIFSVNGFIIALLGISVTAWVKHIDQRIVASIGSLLLCGSFALLPIDDRIEVAFLLCIMMSAGDILFSPASVSLAYALAPRKSEGKLLGIFFATASACRSLGPILGIWALTALGGTATWLLCGLFGVLTASILCGVLRKVGP